MANKNNNNQISKEIAALKQSPLFALSRCSMELAHSNFWKWLIDLEALGETGVHPFVHIFVDDPDYKKLIEVSREEGNRDLTIKYLNKNKKECWHVVENKIKTLPTSEQIERYEDDCKSKFSGGTLTGIENSLTDISDVGSGNWKFLSYEDIAKEIESINKQYKNNKFIEYEIIEKYVVDLKNISQVLKKAKDSSNNVYVYKATKELEDVKLGDIFLKMKADDFKIYLEDKIKSKNQLNSGWGMPVVEVAFNNKKPTISIIYKKNKSDNIEIGKIGVQIEGKQFRIYGGPSEGGASMLKDENKLYNQFIRVNWFEDYNRNTIRNYSTGMRNSYCKYSKIGKYTHLYQWFDIEKCDYTKSLTYDELYKQIESELLNAKQIIDDGKLTFE